MAGFQIFTFFEVVLNLAFFHGSLQIHLENWRVSVLIPALKTLVISTPDSPVDSVWLANKLGTVFFLAGAHCTSSNKQNLVSSRFTSQPVVALHIEALNTATLPVLRNVSNHGKAPDLCRFSIAVVFGECSRQICCSNGVSVAGRFVIARLFWLDLPRMPCAIVSFLRLEQPRPAWPSHMLSNHTGVHFSKVRPRFLD